MDTGSTDGSSRAVNDWVAACDSRTPAGFEHLIAGSTIVPAQLPSQSTWSPEKRLAGAILASALVQIRNRHRDPACRKEVIEDLRWMISDDCTWPFSFVRLCQLFDLEPSWVRMIVLRWVAESPTRLGPLAPRPEVTVGGVPQKEQPRESRPGWSPPPGLQGDVMRRTVHAALS